MGDAVTWRLRIWCRDCGDGMDPMGCFNGGAEVTDDSYETKAAAEAAGWEVCSGPPWAFEVFEEDDAAQSTEAP
jgi:hypothetical protein